MTAISIGNNDSFDIIVAMKLHILVCDGVFDLGLAALTDTVGLANAMSGSLPQAPAHIELTLVGVRRRIRTAQGLTVPVVTAHGVPEPDVVLVPAFGDKMPDTLSARLTRPDVPDAVAALQQWSTAGAHLGAACSGFVATAVLRQLLRACWRLKPAQLAAAMVLPMLAASTVMNLTSRAVMLRFCEDCAPANHLEFVAHSLGYIYVVLAWVGLYLGIKYYRQFQDEARRTLAARSMAHQAQLKMLRYQLNPHFLFNTLNAISTLILDRDNATANRMVQGLSSFLRHSLDNDPMQRVTLRQELDALTLYLDIEKIRFAERLRIETDIDEDCWRALLPSLLLQPLVENAIKYAVARQVAGT